MKLNLDQQFLNEICQIIDEVITKFESSNIDLKVNLKIDQSEVTELDILLSNKLKEALSEFGGIFYSEEEHEVLKFPSQIVDPLDGTKEYIKGSDEWSCSILLASNDEISSEKNIGLIYQPRKKFLFTSFSKPIKNATPLKILVSRSEWGVDQHPKNLQGYIVEPCGSIALKLARLANNEALAVCSLRPKHVWDVAAGSVILNKLGYVFFSEGKEVLRLDKKLFLPPLIWVKKDQTHLLPTIYSKHLGIID